MMLFLRCDVCFVPIADTAIVLNNVHFWGQSRHGANLRECQLLTRCSSAILDRCSPVWAQAWVGEINVAGLPDRNYWRRASGNRNRGNRIAAVGHLSPGIYTRNMQTGEFLEFNDRFKTAARYGAPYYSFHRADLLEALAGGLDRRSIHLGHR